MKCEHCQGTLSLEDAFCPHCGQPNNQARQHQADMARYNAEFQKTEQMVKEKSRRYSEVTARVILLSALIVAFLIALFLAANSYRISRSIKQSQANKKYNEYSKIMQDYLDTEQYLEFAAFVDARELSLYDSPYESWTYTIRLARCYSDVFQNFQKVFFEYESDYNGRYTEYLNDMLDYFYEYQTAEEGDYKAPSTEEEKKALTNMAAQLDLMFRTYSNLSDEEIAGLPYMTKAKRGSLLEDYMEVLKNEE